VLALAPALRLTPPWRRRDRSGNVGIADGNGATNVIRMSVAGNSRGNEAFMFFPAMTDSATWSMLTRRACPAGRHHRVRGRLAKTPDKIALLGQF
jgi:hypothetical protein